MDSDIVRFPKEDVVALCRNHWDELTQLEKLQAYAYTGCKFVTSEKESWRFTIMGELGEVTWAYSEEIGPLLKKLYPNGKIDVVEGTLYNAKFRHTTRIW